MQDLPVGCERIPTMVHARAEQVNAAVAGEFAALIRLRATENQIAVLGLATGSTPIGLYAELVRLHQEEGLSFSNVVSFNLDEYFPMQPDEPQSFYRYMCKHLFDHVDIRPENFHVPDGTVPVEQMADYCRTYEEKIREAGGLDLQILGIGRTGHIGFNEPGSGSDSRTRLVTLDVVTRRDAAGDFLGEEYVPTRAITMGVGTILEARRILLMAFGVSKAPVVAHAVEGPLTQAVAASFLQKHPNSLVVLDRAAASHLTRFKTM